MGDRRGARARASTGRKQVVSLEKRADRSADYTLARGAIEPDLRHAAIAIGASSSFFAGETDVPAAGEVIRDMAGEIAQQDMTAVSRHLTAQAISLDAIYTKLVERSFVNMAQFPDAMERYMRLALKAQSQSRATLETLAKLHQPREQTVRHIHVGPQGQAVFIENLHGGYGSGRSAGQPHADGSAGPATPRAALRSPDADEYGLPLPGDAERQVQDARREIDGRASG